MTRDSTPTVHATRHCARSIASGAELLWGESTLAASTRTRLARDRSKSVADGDAAEIGAVPPHSHRPEGQATMSFRRRTRVMTVSPPGAAVAEEEAVSYG
jgi:hypothetical protein